MTTYLLKLRSAQLRPGVRVRAGILALLSNRAVLLSMFGIHIVIILSPNVRMGQIQSKTTLEAG